MAADALVYEEPSPFWPKEMEQKGCCSKEIHSTFIHLPSCRRNRKRKKREMECLILLMMTHLPRNQSVLTI